MYQTPYNNYYQSPQARYVPGIGLKGRPVSSLEEVKATGIDFDGSIFFFPDIANKRIYTKQINQDGTSTLNMYELAAIPEPISAAAATNFITREEFNQALAQLRQVIVPSVEEKVEATHSAPPTDKNFKF